MERNRVEWILVNLNGIESREVDWRVESSQVESDCIESKNKRMNKSRIGRVLLKWKCWRYINFHANFIWRESKNMQIKYYTSVLLRNKSLKSRIKTTSEFVQNWLTARIDTVTTFIRNLSNHLLKHITDVLYNNDTLM